MTQIETQFPFYFLPFCYFDVAWRDEKWSDMRWLNNFSFPGKLTWPRLIFTLVLSNCMLKFTLNIFLGCEHLWHRGRWWVKTIYISTRFSSFSNRFEILDWTQQYYCRAMCKIVKLDNCEIKYWQTDFARFQMRFGRITHIPHGLRYWQIREGATCLTILDVLTYWSLEDPFYGLMPCTQECYRVPSFMCENCFK